MEHRPAKQKVRAHAWVAGSIPIQGMQKKQPIGVTHIDVSLPLSLFPTLLKKNKKQALAGMWCGSVD